MHRARSCPIKDRCLITLLCLISIVVLPAQGSATNGEVLWSWKVPAGTKFAGYRAYDLGVEHNRFAGVRRWGNEQVLVYAVGGQASLPTRNAENSRAYLLHIYVLNSRTAALETSLELAVESASTELQVVRGGIVVRSGRSLTFLSKQFKQVGPGFVVPLLIAPQAWGVEGEMGDWLKLLVSPDGGKFVLSCEHGRAEKYYLFNGDSFTLERTMTMEEPIRAESFGDSTLLFRGSDDTNSVHAAHFTQADVQVSSLIYSAEHKSCATAVYIDARQFANVCNGVSIVNLAGKETVVETLAKGEVQSGRGILSADGTHLAVARRRFKGGSSFFDISPRITGFVVRVFELEPPRFVVQLPVDPAPKEICDYVFTDNDTLVVMADDKVTAYNLSSDHGN